MAVAVAVALRRPPLQTKLPARLAQFRSFVDAKVKWVRDPYLDFVVEREKDLFQAISFKNHILSVSDSSKSLPLSLASLLKPHFNLSIPSSSFFHNHPSFFSVFQPSPGLSPRVRLTRRTLSLHHEESSAFDSVRYDAVCRISRLLMIAGGGRLPLRLIERLRWDLGLPHDFVTSLLSDFPDYFQVCEVRNPSDGKSELAIEIVSWRKNLAVSELEKRSSPSHSKRITFPMSFPRGFDLGKKVKDWVQKWQLLPYISPYENGFHLSPGSDQAEKWTVAVLHEVLWLTVSKKTERENLVVLGEWLGFGIGSRLMKKALVHHPGIFYVSNKNRTQTVVLREAYRKDFLLEKHPLMAMRYRYIHLLNQMPKFKKPNLALDHGIRRI